MMDENIRKCSDAALYIFDLTLVILFHLLKKKIKYPHNFPTIQFKNLRNRWDIFHNPPGLLIA